ncbi:Myblike DNAbinding domain-containing protein [Podila clonocystis]|nr:Myblike DNAbinding domain-containing protein [Podila clonocystis]
MDSKILDMRLEGNTWKEIGEAIGRDANVCHQRYVKELDPTLYRDWSPQRLEELNKMVAAGKTWREISERFLVIPAQCREKWASINPDLVAQAKQRKQLNRRIGNRSALVGLEIVPETGSVLVRPHRWCPHMDNVLIDLRERGLTWRQIGTVFGITPMTAYMRYAYKLKPKLDSGWVPPTQDATNTAFYLLKDRPRPVVAASSLMAVDGIELSESAVSKSTRPWLNSISEEYSYSTESTPESRRVWTPEEDAALIAHRNEGSGFATIGREMSIDPDACYYRYFTALDPASQKKWTIHHSDRLCFFIKHGLSWSVISYALGFHRLVCKKMWLEISGAQIQSSSTEPNKDSSQDPTSANVDSVSTHDKGPDQSGASHTARYNTLMDDHVQDEDYDGESFEGEDDDDGEDVIDRLGSGFREDSDAYEVDGDETDDGDLLDTDDGEDEGVVGGRLAMGRHAKEKSKLSRSHSPERTHSIWDQDAYLKEVQKSWTLDQENTLIQHVIRNGTHNWNEISNHFGGTHSPEECRAYWKYLDMPVVRGTTKESIWEPQGEAQFWRLWLEYGSDFEKISSQLRTPIRHDAEESGLSALSGSTGARSTAEDCTELFKLRTGAVSKELGNDESSEEFQQACVELALSRSTPPAFKWDKEKSVKLQKLVRQRLRTRGVHVNWINWKWVARHVGSGVTAQRCNLHWRWLRKIDTDAHEWTEEDIQLLEQGVREIGPVFHHEISEANAGDDGVENMSTSSSSSGPGLAGFKTIQRFYLPDRTVDKLQRKYFLLSDKATQVTVEEYMAIMDAVEEHGEDWDKVAESLRALNEETSRGLPSGFNTTAWTKAPCRRVWEGSYKHTLQHTPWTEREDQDLKDAVRQIGKSDWLIIARFFPGKSPWQCRLRWCSITDPVSSVANRQ